MRGIGDPRLYQIAALGSLVLFGSVRLGFDLHPAIVSAILATSLGAQFLMTRAHHLPRLDFRSALITALSLSLLLRTGSLLTACAAAAAAIASKFVLRWNGKHVFNPANLGLCVAVLAGDAWISPGQWGSAAFLGLLIVCAGGFVAHSALRSDVALAFLAIFSALVFGRSLWLGDPMAVPLHKLQTGALLIFAFFMISDPKTTPDRRAGRMIFAALVAAVAAWLTFSLHSRNGLIWSLALCAPLTPIIDRWLPGLRYRWPERHTPIPASPPVPIAPRELAP